MLAFSDLRLNSTYEFVKYNRIGPLMVTDFVDLYNNRLDIEKTLKPIPITEEWLLKHGFLCSDISCYLPSETNHVLFFKRVTDGDIKYLETHLSNMKVLYVHQVQNIYYGLYGKELEPKL